VEGGLYPMDWVTPRPLRCFPGSDVTPSAWQIQPGLTSLPSSSHQLPSAQDPLTRRPDRDSASLWQKSTPVQEGIYHVESGLPDGMRDITTPKLFRKQRRNSMCRVATVVRPAMGAEFTVPLFCHSECAWRNAVHI
jgi:hypothetical protein